MRCRGVVAVAPVWSTDGSMPGVRVVHGVGEATLSRLFITFFLGAIVELLLDDLYLFGAA